MIRIFFKWFLFSQGFGAAFMLLTVHEAVSRQPLVLAGTAGAVLAAFGIGWMARHAWD